jgi:hypothetical protein
MFSTVTPPRSVDLFCRDIVPLLHRRVSPERLVELVAEIVATDRWNSYDRFHQTSETLQRSLREAGASTEVYAVQTGGEIGGGRWVIHEAQDVRAAVVDIVHPVQRRIIDYAENPWQAIQWSGRSEEFVKRAGFVLMAGLATHDKKAGDERFAAFLPVIIRESTDERNFVRKAVSWALRSIGKRNLNLNRAAIQAAETIHQMPDRSARWVAADALRELQSDAVQARLEARSSKLDAKELHVGMTTVF